MKHKLLSILMLIALCIMSCKDAVKQNDTEQNKSPDKIVTSTLKDKDGKTLTLSFNNTKNIVVLNFNGETIELKSQKPASGIWYKNDLYELRGKGKTVELTKDGKTVFKN